MTDINCKHEEFRIDLTMNYLEDIEARNADIKIRCIQCDRPFCFLGVPFGLSLQGAACSVDRTELRIAVVPQGEEPPLFKEPVGFGVSYAH